MLSAHIGLAMDGEGWVLFADPRLSFVPQNPHHRCPRRDVCQYFSS